MEIVDPVKVIMHASVKPQKEKGGGKWVEKLFKEIII